MPIPLAADWFEVLVAFVMFFVAIIGWIGQLVGKNQQAKRPAPKRDPGVQNEIERFLNEVTGQKQGRQKQRPQPRQDAVRAARRPPEKQAGDQRRRPPQRKAVKVVSRGDESEQERARKSQSAGSAQSTSDKARSSQRRRPAPEVQQAGSKKLRRKKLESHIAEQVADDLPHLSTALHKPPTTVPLSAKQPKLDIAAALANPDNVKLAVIMNEVLSKPRSLRK